MKLVLSVTVVMERVVEPVVKLNNNKPSDRPWPSFFSFFFWLHKKEVAARARKPAREKSLTEEEAEVVETGRPEAGALAKSEPAAKGRTAGQAAVSAVLALADTTAFDLVAG